LLFNLRTDPYEFAQVTSNTYYDWFLQHSYIAVPAQEIVANFISTFKEFPPRQSAASFNLDDVLKSLQETAGGK
jgi:arylsulfatase